MTMYPHLGPNTGRPSTPSRDYRMIQGGSPGTPRTSTEPTVALGGLEERGPADRPKALKHEVNINRRLYKLFHFDMYVFLAMHLGCLGCLVPSHVPWSPWSMGARPRFCWDAGRGLGAQAFGQTTKHYGGIEVLFLRIVCVYVCIVCVYVLLFAHCLAQGFGSRPQDPPTLGTTRVRAPRS